MTVSESQEVHVEVQNLNFRWFMACYCESLSKCYNARWFGYLMIWSFLETLFRVPCEASCAVLPLETIFLLEYRSNRTVRQSMNRWSMKYLTSMIAVTRALVGDQSIHSQTKNLKFIFEFRIILGNLLVRSRLSGIPGSSRNFSTLKFKSKTSGGHWNVKQDALFILLNLNDFIKYEIYLDVIFSQEKKDIS